MIGGGGSPAARSELLLQIIAAICLLAMVFSAEKPGAQRNIPRAAKIAGTLMLALPIAQLIPLPPAIWQMMPGRELAQQSLALVGSKNDWRPWSLFPGRTLASLMAIIPAVIVMLSVSRLEPAERRWLAPVIAFAVMLSVFLGAMQLAGGPGSALRFYSYSNPGFLNGFQANRNAQADVLLIGLVASMVTLSAMRDRHARRGFGCVAAILCIIMALAVILTGSRAGMGLLVATLAVSAALWFGRNRKMLVGAFLSLPAMALIIYFTSGSGRFQPITQRFSFAGEFRQELWTDAMFAIAQYWPMGAGLGSASPVLIAAERLEVVDASRPNRVHNDYLELALEGGFFAIAIGLVIGIVVVWKIVQRLKKNDKTLRLENYLAISALTILALHSIVDYPMRSMSLAMLGAAAVGALLGRQTSASSTLKDTGNES